jgi:hypothetical protein
LVIIGRFVVNNYRIYSAYSNRPLCGTVTGQMANDCKVLLEKQIKKILMKMTLKMIFKVRNTFSEIHKV